MTEPSLALQRAVYARLLGATGAGDAVYDAPPKSAPYPRITLGAAQVIADDVDCIDGAQVFLEAHVWAREPGFTRCKEIAGQARDLLHRADLALEGHALIALDVESIRFMRDPDGMTSHGNLTLRALTEPQD